MFFLEYYAGLLGGVCNDESHVIRTQEECTKAIQILGYQSNEPYWTGMTGSIPSGCSVRTTRNNSPHLELSPAGLGNGRFDQLPICRIPTGDYYYIRLSLKKCV